MISVVLGAERVTLEDLSLIHILSVDIISAVRHERIEEVIGKILAHDHLVAAFWLSLIHIFHVELSQQYQQSEAALDEAANGVMFIMILIIFFVLWIMLDGCLLYTSRCV